MAGIALILDRDGRSIESQLIKKTLAMLAHSGLYRSQFHKQANIALGQTDIPATTGNPVEEHSPLSNDSNIFVAFDGRIDNQDEIVTALRSSDQLALNGNNLSTVAIVLASYLRWDEACFQRLHGSMAIIIVDYRRPKVLLYRDPMGNRSLFYYLCQTQLLVASEECALLPHIPTPIKLDQAALTPHFALSKATNNRTAFLSVKELMPGESMVWTPDKIQLRRISPQLGMQSIRYKSDEEYAEHYRSLLNQAVASRLPSDGHVGVMLSGGVDSCSVAALAQQQLQRRGQSLTAYSWSLTDFPSADETRFIQQCAAHLDIRLTLIPGEPHWPLKDLSNWPVCLSTPIGNCFRRLILAVYQAAADDGCKVILNGHFGDNIYPHPRHRMADMLENRKLGLLVSEFAWLLRHTKPAKLTQDTALREIAKRLLRWQTRQSPPPHWLTPQACQLLEPEQTWPPEAINHPRPDHYREVLGLEHSGGTSKEIYFPSQFGIERRHPYKDYRLIDFMLSIPAYQCWRLSQTLGQTKLVARQAMKGLLPDSIRLKPRTGLLSDFFDYGMFNKERQQVKNILFAADAEWPWYVDKTWLQNAFDNKDLTEREKVVIWQCIAFELWRKALVEKGLL